MGKAQGAFRAYRCFSSPAPKLNYAASSRRPRIPCDICRSCDESTCQPRPENFALAGCRSDRGLTERDKHRGERCRRCVRPLSLKDRKLKIRQERQAVCHAENAKSGDNRARRKRRDRETSQGCGADTRKTGARADDLPDQFTFAKRNERCLARNRTLAV